MSGIRAFDRQPVASTTYCAVTVLPSDVVTDHMLAPSSNAARSTRVLSWISRAQIEPVGDVVGVFQDLRLRRIALAPVPFLLQFVRERIGILHALDVAARAGIAVPVPGAADIAALLIDPHRQSQPAQPVQHVHSGKAGADHDDIVGLGGAAGFCRKRMARRTWMRAPWNFCCCRSAFYPRRESARDKTATGLHIAAECSSRASR